MRPVSLKREGDGLKIEWSDGATTFATWRHLRNCPCASCIEDRGEAARPVSRTDAARGRGRPAATGRDETGRPLRLPDHLERRPRTGIYPVERLRELGEPPK